ncbi:MAG: hypothetical protein MUE97_04210 [Phycisphaerales bacterium]|jgi:hypothetical protein|nr:hypothetical protein [Phycisphaerales bacterium]
MKSMIMTAVVAMAAGSALATGSSSSPFTTVYPNGAGIDKDLLVTSVNSGGIVVNSNRFVYASSITNFDYSGGLNQIRTVRGPWTTNTSPFQKLEAQDGNPHNITTADKQAFNADIRAAFANNNLNNFLDITGGHEWKFEMHFASAIRDNNNGNDNAGELMLFERGSGGANSYFVLQPLSLTGQAIGKSYLVTPEAMQRLSPSRDLPIFDNNGNVAGQQTVEGLLLDLSRDLGVTSLSKLLVRSARAGDAGFPAHLPHGTDIHPDFKIIGIPTPGAAALLGLGGLAVARRRRVK